MCFALQRRALFRHLNFQKWSGPGVFCTFWLRHVLRATTACTFSTSQLPKVVRHWCVLYIFTSKCASRHNTVSTSEPPKVARTCSVLYILTSKCASRHNGVHLFDISTPKSGPRMVCFVHFDLEMCFAPQRRALFGHLNFQKWSGPGVFCTFWLGNVLRATTACTFWTSQLPKAVRTWCALYILTSKCASRHNGVHFLNISTSKSGPDLVCFVHFDCFAPQRRALFRHLNFQKWSGPGVFCTCSLRHVLRLTTACNFSTDVSAPAALASLLFSPPEPQNHEKTQWFATFLPFRAPASSFFLSFLFWLFSLLTAFSSLHIVGSLTSKLPSIRGFCVRPLLEV